MLWRCALDIEHFLGQGRAGREGWDTPSNIPEERKPQVLQCSTSGHKWSRHYGVPFAEIKTADQGDDKVLTFNHIRSRGCAVGVATRSRTGGSGVPYPAGKRCLCLLQKCPGGL